MTARGWLLRVHRWIGLALGLVLLVSAITGMALLTGGRLEPAFVPPPEGAAARAPAPLDDVIAAVRRAHPGLPLARLRLPRHDADVYEAWLVDDRGPRVYVHPDSAAVLATESPSGTLKGWVFTVHTTLLAGAAGHALVGAGAFALLGLVVSGVVVWWPGLRNVRRGLTVRRGRRVADVHRIAGVLSAPVLALIAFTGASLVFPASFDTMTAAVTLSDARQAAPVWPGGAPGPARAHSALVSAAERALPGGRVSWIYFPAGGSGWLTVRKRMPGEAHPNGKSFVYVHPVTGEAAGAIDARRNDAGPRLFDAFYPAHIGQVLGRAVHAAAAGALLLLVVTGWAVWVRRVAGSRRVRARAVPR